MSDAKFSFSAHLRQALAPLPYVERHTAPFPNMTTTFPEDDGLFIHELFRCFPSNFGYDLARSVKGEVCSEMHSSRGPSCLPPEPTLRPSDFVPMPSQHALCGDRYNRFELAPFFRQ